MAQGTPPDEDAPAARKHRDDKRTLTRLFAWGSAAVAAVAILAVTTQTNSGGAQLRVAFAPDTQSTSQVVALMPQAKSPDVRLLEEQVRTLAADRDRLAARLSVLEPRMALLEHNLDDMTGSIKKQVEQTAALAAKVSTPTAAPAAQPAAEPRMTNSVKTESIRVERPASVAPAPFVAPEPTTASSDQPVTVGVPLPLPRMAALSPSEPPAEAPKKPEIGVDIGGAPTMEVLTLRWTAVKANFGPLLNGLRPLAVHVRRQNATDMRLLIGPLPTIAAANQLCARFASARVTCRPAKFEGDELAQR